MEIEIFNKLEKEIDRLFNVLVELKEENKQIKEKYQRLIEKQNEDKEIIETLKNEKSSLPSTSNNILLKKEAKVKEGLKRILTKLENLSLILL